ncbi:cytochrome P450 pc-3 [Phanerochaete sordida]|uniref:Cytochrome P450 pc-3 n=1 Tax=Phanerochaete sordida TaxID=48140 RepID=A0A9P3FX86_9APHY|nr:cytochrome P450 pc-3 [Phanerochaete sordida]
MAVVALAAAEASEIATITAAGYDGPTLGLAPNIPRVGRLRTLHPAPMSPFSSLELPEPLALRIIAYELYYILTPVLPAALALVLLQRWTDVALPTWAVAALALLSLPVAHAITIYRNQWVMARKAARMGAVLPPRLAGKWLGGIDLLVQLTDSFENGFLSDMLFKHLRTLGQTFEIYILWDNNYVTDDANVVKTILATDFNSFVKGKRFDVCMRSVLGTGVFNSDGDMWKFHRSMTRPFFTRERIGHFDLFDRHADDAMAKMKARFAEGHAVDFQDLISRFTLDSATEFLFGRCVHSLAAPLPYPHGAPPHLRAAGGAAGARADDFARAFAEAQTVLNWRIRMGWLWPWMELFGSRTRGPMRVVDAFLDPILRAAVERADALKRENGGRAPEVKEGIEEDETLLDHLVKYTNDPKILHDEVLNIMIAGRDTTAGTLTVAIYFLSQYPDVLRRLREEILEKVGPTRRPTYDDIREMKYLRAFINETLRLYPAVPWNVRYAVKDTTIPGPDPDKPYFISANSPISYSVHCMHRRTDYWGPDAETFDPTRFLDARVQRHLTPNPFVFLPFNAGPRICLGQQFAYNEMSFFVIRLLQHFDRVELREDALPPGAAVPPAWKGAPGRKGVERFWAKAHLTLYAKGGLWVKMREASNAEAV